MPTPWVTKRVSYWQSEEGRLYKTRKKDKLWGAFVYVTMKGHPSFGQWKKLGDFDKKEEAQDRCESFNEELNEHNAEMATRDKLIAKHAEA